MIDFKHVALPVSSPGEIKDFYTDILEMKQIRSFILNQDLAEQIFGIKSEIPAYLLHKDNLYLEVFILPQNKEKSINHICFSIKNREELIHNVLAKGYECIRIKRETNDLVFIKDKSGNIFEIKKE